MAFPGPAVDYEPTDVVPLASGVADRMERAATVLDHYSDDSVHPQGIIGLCTLPSAL